VGATLNITFFIKIDFFKVLKISFAVPVFLYVLTVIESHEKILRKRFLYSQIVKYCKKKHSKEKYS